MERKCEKTVSDDRYYSQRSLQFAEIVDIAGEPFEYSPLIDEQ